MKNRIMNTTLVSIGTYSVGLTTLTLLSGAALAGGSTGFVSVAAYRQPADSPFISNTLIIDTFEPGPLVPGITTFGVTANIGGNSVDIDDGTLDGNGDAGKSLAIGSWGPFTPGSASFTYSSEVLGGLPTQVGLVITDLDLSEPKGPAVTTNVTLQCILSDGSTVNTIYAVLSQPNNALDDLFIGYSSSLGIASMSVFCEVPMIVDHLQYALPPQLLTPAVNDDFDGDGRSDVAWSNQASRGGAIWHVNGTAVTGEYTSILASSTTAVLVATADADANGRADMLWYDAATARYSVWLMNGFSASATMIDRYVGSDWIPAGYFDINADRKADVIFRRTSGGQTQVAVWLMNGAAIASSELTTLSGEFDQMFVGNLDADSTGEAILRSSSGAQLGGVFVSEFTGSSIGTPSRVLTSSGSAEPLVDVSYSIAGLADITGDGVSDVLWRGPTGSIVSWQMKNRAIESKSVLSAGATNYWTIASFPDFDGDGTQGIFFRGGSGETWSWRMQVGVITQSNALNTVQTAWKTVGTQH